MRKLFQNENHKRHRERVTRQNLKKRGRKRKTGRRDSKVNKKSFRKNKPISFDGYFSFIENTEKVISYFKEARTLGQKRKRKVKVFLDLKKIEGVTVDAIVIYIAHITNFNFSFEGNVPQDCIITFIKSGFYDYVKSFFISDDVRNLIKENPVYRHISDKKIDINIARSVCEEIFDKNQKDKSLYSILIELMSNTNNHAHYEKAGYWRWFFQAYLDEEQSVYKCTFVDLGVGIFESEEVKKYKKTNLRKFTSGFKDDNASLFKRMLSGEEKITKTGRSVRGKGLPRINRVFKNEKGFLKCVIISNDVYADIKNEGSYIGKIKLMNKKFQGTFFYWEMKSK